MADLYGNASDGIIYSSIDATWANARDDSSGTVSSTSNTATGNLASVSKFASRGGGSTYRVNRGYIWFDTSGITGTVTSATIKVYGFSANDGSIIAVKSTAFGGDGSASLAAGDLDAITGYSAGSSLAGNATTYGPQILTSSWSTSGYNDFTGTSDLRADMQNNDAVIICFMDYTNDYLNSAPGSGGTLNVGAYLTNSSGTSKDPYIEYEVAAAGYTHDVNSVAAASIGKINTVATASIGKINSLD